MKKAIITAVSLVGFISLFMVPEEVTFAFFIDYIIRLGICAWASNAYCKLEK